MTISTRQNHVEIRQWPLARSDELASVYNTQVAGCTPHCYAVSPEEFGHQHQPAQLSCAAVLHQLWLSRDGHSVWLCKEMEQTSTNPFSVRNL